VLSVGRVVILVLQLIHVTREWKLQNSKQRDESRSPYLGILLVYLGIQKGISKIEKVFRISRGFFEMFRPAYVNALGPEYRPGRPLHKETRRRIIDLYLTGERLTAISRAVCITPGAVCGISISLWYVLRETICHTEWEPKWCSSQEVQSKGDFCLIG